MASPYDYSISSFIVSNINNDDDSNDEFEEDEISNDQDEETSEISITTDMDTSLIDSDYEEHAFEMSTSGEGDSIVYDSIHEIDASENSESENDEEEEIVQDSKRFKIDKNEDEHYEGSKSIDSDEKCPICLTAWTNVGDHRLCALRCGHLFGYKCIKQWLNSDNESAKKCPQCNAKASTRHIRFIYACKLTCLDNTEIEKMKKRLAENNLKLEKVKRALVKERRRKKKYKQMYKARALALTTDSDFCLSD